MKHAKEPAPWSPAASKKTFQSYAQARVFSKLFLQLNFIIKSHYLQKVKFLTN